MCVGGVGGGACACAWMHACVHACVCVCVCPPSLSWIFCFSFVCVCVCVCVSMHAFVHTCVYACMHVYVCACMSPCVHVWMNRCSWKTYVEAWKGNMRSSQPKMRLFSSSCSVAWTHHLSKEKGWATDSQHQPLFTVQTETGADEVKLHTCQGWKRSCQEQSQAQPISSACWAAPCQLLASAGLTETPLASPSAERPGSLLSALSCNDMHMPVWNWGKRRSKTENRLTLHIYSLDGSTHCCIISKPNINLTWLKINCHWLFLLERSGYSLKVVFLSKRFRFNTFVGDQSTQLNLKNCVSESLIDFTSNLENSFFSAH